MSLDALGSTPAVSPQQLALIDLVIDEFLAPSPERAAQDEAPAEELLPRRLYGGIARVLKPGGRYVFRFAAELFEDTSDTHLSRTIPNVTPPVPGQPGLAVFVDDLARKAANSRRSLEEGQIRLVIGVFRAG